MKPYAVLLSPALILLRRRTRIMEMSLSVERFSVRPGVVSILPVFGLVAMLAIGPAAAQSIDFGPKLDYATGSSPIAAASGDLNGDGWPDLAVANVNAASVSVLLGDGKGGFGAKVAFTTGDSPSSVAIGDLNRDGSPDLAVANDVANTISVLLGNGAGSFWPKLDFVTGDGPYSVAIGDLNGDGRLDLTTANRGSNTVSVLLGDGAGGFGAKSDFLTGTTPLSVAVGDLNGDGWHDLAVANSADNTISVLAGDGVGGFGAKTDFVTGAYPISIATGDLNGDGWLDLAVATYSTNSTSVHLSDGAGGFGAKTDYFVGAAPIAVAIGDLDGDRRPDLAVASYTGNAVAVLRGIGAGGFGAPTGFSVGNLPRSIVIGDLNGDGSLDLTAANFGSNTASVFLGEGASGVGARRDFATGPNPEALAVGDLNGDGWPDLVTANFSSGTVSVLRGDGASGSAGRADFATEAGPSSVISGDLNDDGWPDLAVANFDSNSVSVLLGDGLLGVGAGGFAAQTVFTTGAGPRSIASGDLNGDGWLDLATANMFSQSISVLLGDGAGGFSAQPEYLTWANPYSVTTADLNGDGWLDLALANIYAHTITVLLGDGTATNWIRRDFATGLEPNTVVSGDLNGDGQFDLATANRADNTVSVLLGDGAGGFGTKTDFAAGTEPLSVAIGDLNSDGRVDLVVGQAAPYVSVLLGDGLLGIGAGGFKNENLYGTGFGPHAVAIGDLNGDGRPALVAANAFSSTVSILSPLETTQTFLAVTPPTAMLGAPVLLTATVSVPGPSASAPGDSVSFFDGFTLLGTAPVTSGVANFAFLAPRPGMRPLSAVYYGDERFLGSISATQVQYVAATAAPTVTSIEDITADQGLRVRLKFAASGFDHLGSTTPIANYFIYRQSTGANKAMLDGTAMPAEALFAGWDFVGALPATADGPYQLVVPTLADSNNTGIHRAVFFVRAATSTPGLYYDAAPDSGYSVDNLAPAPPTGFLGDYLAGATELQWDASPESDFRYHRIYRGATEGFEPDENSLIATSSQVTYTDSGPSGLYYKLSTVDVNGNESTWALLRPAQVSDVPGASGTELRLYPNHPNPFNPRTTIRFDLPQGGAVRLVLFDLAGRLVKTLVDGDRTVGSHEVVWNGRDATGRTTPSGTYFARLEAGGKSETVRMSLIR